MVGHLREVADQRFPNLDAQRVTIKRLAHELGGLQIGREFVEHETLGGPDRPELDLAIAHCKRTSSALAIAELGQLIHDQSFLDSVFAGVPTIFADYPEIASTPSGRIELGLVAAGEIAWRKRIGVKTKAALASLRAKGVQLGTPNLDQAARSLEEPKLPLAIGPLAH